MPRIKPVIGSWYQDREVGQKFEVVAIDEDYVELQHIDGEIEELDIESWHARPIGKIAQPEDWAAPFEVEGDDHFGQDESHKSEWHDPLDEIEADSIELDIDDFDNNYN